MKTKALFLFISGIFVFISTFLRSYLNGDDIVHFSGMDSRIIYFPKFVNSWIPNRVFDQYFRTLDVNLFDFFYLFQRNFLHIDFFVFFKLYSGIVYTFFIIISLLYFEKVLEGRLAGVGVKFNSLIRPVILVGLLSIFPWTNHTHLFAYQIPSFLCFLLISKLGTAELKTDKLDLSFLFLGFICAFTLEAYTAIVLIVLLFFLLVCYKKQASTIPLFTVISFNLVSLLVMALYSQRSAINGIDSGQYFASLKNIILSPLFLASLLSLMVLFTLNLKVKARIGWLLVSIVSSLLVCILISLVTNGGFNYEVQL